jgi:MFS family permease
VPDRDRRFLFLFALANAGGVVAYVPLLTLILPARISELAGDARIEWLSAVAFVGAIGASVGNILFGWASDVVGGRRAWAAAGLGLTLASYALIFVADTKFEIVTAVFLYQVVLNMMLAPMTAWAADRVPDEDKGLLGGMLAAGPPVGALAGVLATAPALTTDGSRLAIVCALLVALVGPLLVLVRAPIASGDNMTQSQARSSLRLDFGIIWAARLLVQIAGSVLFVFLLYFFQSLPAPATQNQVARISAVTLLVAFPLTLVLGRISDRLGPRKPFLVGSALAGALGLALMSSSDGLWFAVAGYALFSCATAVFLSLHNAYAMQLLPSPARRGRDMGVMNLTNTLPAFVAPGLAMWLVPGRGFGLLLMLLAGALIVAAICVALVRTDAQGVTAPAKDDQVL